MKFKIYIGADHRGVTLKAKVVKFLSDAGYAVTDLGSFDENVPCDYPKLSFAVAGRVSRDPQARGILICLTGIGHSIAANKVKGAYAALCQNEETAVLSRQHNNANILVLGANFIKGDKILDIIKIWLETDFEGGRHLRRVRQIKAMENKLFKAVK
ncbi:MAG: ribose 5-phosphate isomerase B [Candidatus Omnitrophica bacterium]|nr:ribose 5-phosphate isomerase B [Candidatus Omnitrophota bacterium]